MPDPVGFHCWLPDVQPRTLQSESEARHESGGFMPVPCPGERLPFTPVKPWMTDGEVAEIFERQGFPVDFNSS